MQSDSATLPAEEQVSERLTAGAVKNKIKRMVVDLLNSGMRGGVYTTNMITPAHTFEQLHMTEHEKMRLIMQCDEFFKVDTDVSVIGAVRVGDLINKVVDLLTAQDRIEVPPAKTMVTSDKAETTEE